ncbi:MAG: ATP synthase subunit c [Candidatus Heimdallarchaeota archaeon AB_125]|nr:MAG: ATP synthase subunit c [Candidatus Heimdallarchaeota archaeon AB_125]
MAVEGYILGIMGIAGTMLTILGAGIPLAKGVQAAAAAVAEKQRLNIFILIYLALAEALAIYGLLIAFVMYTKIQPYLDGTNLLTDFTPTYGWIYIAAMFIMVVSNLGAAITLAKGEPAAIGSITANSEVFTPNLIYLALGEALAIYGLLIAFILLNIVV